MYESTYLPRKKVVDSSMLGVSLTHCFSSLSLLVHFVLLFRLPLFPGLINASALHLPHELLADNIAPVMKVSYVSHVSRFVPKISHQIYRYYKADGGCNLPEVTVEFSEDSKFRAF